MTDAEQQALLDNITEVGDQLGAKIFKKSESPLMRILAKILFFNTRFISSYTTTIGKRIYLADGRDRQDNKFRTAATLAHELVHVADYRAHPVVFIVGYLFPQLLAGLAFLALGAIWGSSAWLLCLWFLVFLLPIPAPGRTHYELRAYAVTQAMWYWIGSGALPDFSDKYTRIFTGPDYYYMWPFPKTVSAAFEVYRVHIRSRTLCDVVPIAYKLERAVLRSVK